MTFVNSPASRGFVVRSKYHKAPVGYTYGKWWIIDYSHYDNEHYWLVQCECGKIEPRRAGQLVQGRTKSCRTCAAIGRENERSPYWEGKEGISKQYLSRLKWRQKEIDITLDDLIDIWKAQKGSCAYSGVKLKLVFRDADWNTSTASIDRIDSSKGYIKGNIQWVHKRINTMKNDMIEEEFIEWCRLVSIKKGGVCGS